MDSSSIIWSQKVTILKALASKVSLLPQVVQVEDGYYGGNDETTLSSGDVLTIHLRKKIRSYKAISEDGSEINIPVNIEAKVEVLSREAPEIFDDARDLVRKNVGQVEWMHNTPWLDVKEGDILQVHDVVDKGGLEYVRMSFISKTQSDIFVPLNYRTTFKSAVKRTMWLTEIEKQASFPVTIKFIDKSLQLNTEATDTAFSDLSTIADLGQVIIQGIQEKDVFIASIQDEGLIRVLKIPIHMDITIRLGVAVNQDDYTYVDVCTEYNKRARLEQMDDMMLDSIRIGDSEATVERIYEFPRNEAGSDDESGSDYEDFHDYIEPAPCIPSRAGRPPLRSQAESSSEDDSESKYDPNKPLPSTPRADNKMKISKKFFKSFHIPHHKQKSANIVPSHKDSEDRAQLKLQNTKPISHQEPDRYVKELPRAKSVPVSKSSLVSSSQVSDIPQNLEEMSCEEVCKCLKLLNMDRHIGNFYEQQIDGSLLVELTQEEFLSLGVTDPFEKKKLSKFIGGWRPRV